MDLRLEIGDCNVTSKKVPKKQKNRACCEWRFLKPVLVASVG
jgi:hypothetical protein